MSDWRGPILLSVIVFLAVCAAINPSGPLPQIANQGRPPIAQQQTPPSQEPSSNQSGPDIAARGSAASPLYVKAACEHGCGYSENDKGWWEQLWTDPTATFTGALFLVTAALVGATYLLWNSTRDSVRIAERALKDTERAFVFMDRYSVHPSLAHDGHVRNWNFTPVLKNSGATPTRRLYIHVSAQTLDPTHQNFDYPDVWGPDGVQERNNCLIGPNAEIEAFAPGLHIVDLSKVKSGELIALIWGWIEYDDVFDASIRHRTEFCNQIKVSGELDVAAGCPFFFPIYGPHNGADGDCLKKVQT